MHNHFSCPEVKGNTLLKMMKISYFYLLVHYLSSIILSIFFHSVLYCVLSTSNLLSSCFQLKTNSHTCSFTNLLASNKPLPTVVKITQIMGFEINDAPYFEGLTVILTGNLRKRDGIYWQVLKAETRAKQELLYPNLGFAAQFISIQQTIYVSCMVWLCAFKITAFELSLFFFQLRIFFHPFNPKQPNQWQIIKGWSGCLRKKGGD